MVSSNREKKCLKRFVKIAQIKASRPAHCALRYALEEFKRPTGGPPKNDYA